MTSPSPSKSSRSRPADRRRFHRFLAEPADIQVHTGSKTVQGNLVNESIGGLALTTHDASSFLVGQAVETHLREAVSTAYVRSIRRDWTGNYRVGMSWNKEPYRNINANADYLAYEDLMLVCVVVCDQSGPVRTVRLWDGAEFQVMPDAIYSRSYEKRRDELNEAPNHLPTLAQLYGLSPDADTHAIVSDILDFEFSSQFDTTCHSA